MKNYYSILAIFIIVSLAFSCTKETIVVQEVPATTSATQQPCSNGISYPDSAFYGLNVLAQADSALMSIDSTYSFHAILDCGANLQIRITSISGTIWYYFPGSSQGWNITPYDNINLTQVFQSNVTGSLMLHMVLGSGGWGGICRIDFYENSTTITKTKYLYWA